jgi:hypothetical protein
MNRLRSFIFEQIKSLMFVIAFGILGGNLLGALMGGFSVSQASKQSLVVPQAAAENLHYVLDPSNPALLDSVEFSVMRIDGSDPFSVKVKIDTLEWTACSRSNGGSNWFCPLNGVSVSDLDRIQIWTS